MDSLPMEEPRKRTVSAALTESEHWAVLLVAKTEDRHVSDLMREFSLGELIARGEGINARLREGVAA
jgi:hypothetical protein